MSKLPIFSLFKVIFDNRSAFRFLAGTIASCSFSVAVILCTIGLMDGFDFTLKKALSHSNGDIKISGHDDFFLVDNKTKKSFIKENLLASSFLLQIEAFALVNEESKGVLLKGIEKKSFSIVTGLDVSTLDNGIIIGKQFQKLYNLKIGDSVVVAFASGSAKDQGSATLKEFFVEGIVRHGVYEKDLRFIYIDKTTLSKILGYKTDISNLGFIKIQDFSNINQVIKNLNSEFSDRFVFRPYWSEFEVLLDAVKIEKLSISIVLQLIVIVAVLNVVGFIVFVLETKALDFFMLRAFGLSFYMIQKFWYLLLFFISIFSCLISLGLIEIFSNFILKLPFLKIPGDIYVLSELEVVLDPLDYTYVFGIFFLWVFLVGFFSMRSQAKKSLLSGLRQGFS